MLRACLCLGLLLRLSGLLSGLFLSFFLLTSTADGTGSCPDGRAGSGVSRNRADGSTSRCSFSRTLDGSSLWRRATCRLCSLLLGGLLFLRTG
jgi:hypothetical protein